jgi:hypothetical protein
MNTSAKFILKIFVNILFLQVLFLIVDTKGEDAAVASLASKAPKTLTMPIRNGSSISSNVKSYYKLNNLTNSDSKQNQSTGSRQSEIALQLESRAPLHYDSYPSPLIRMKELSNQIRQSKTEFESFKVNSKRKNQTNYEYDYANNFIKLIENFLLKHLKTLIDKQPISNQNAYDNQNGSNANANSKTTADSIATANYIYYPKYTTISNDMIQTELSTSTSINENKQLETSTPTETTEAQQGTMNEEKSVLKCDDNGEEVNCAPVPSMNVTLTDVEVMMATLVPELLSTLASLDMLKSGNISSLESGEFSSIESTEPNYSNNSTGYLAINHNASRLSGKSQLNSNHSLKSTLASYDYELAELKQTVYNYKNYFVYFISIIIFLATVCIILLIITFISCIVNCKQRARLNYFSENEFFTYYNKNAPVIASVSSFSLTPNCIEHKTFTLPNSSSLNNKTYNTQSGAHISFSNNSACTNSTNELLLANNNNNSNNNNYNGAIATANNRFNPNQFDHSRLSTHLFGNKSSLTLFNEQHAAASVHQPVAYVQNMAPTTRMLGSTHSPRLGTATARAEHFQLYAPRQAPPPSSTLLSNQSSFKMYNTKPHSSPPAINSNFLNMDNMAVTASPCNPLFNRSISERLTQDQKLSLHSSSIENLHRQHMNFIAGIRDTTSRSSSSNKDSRNSIRPPKQKVKKESHSYNHPHNSNLSQSKKLKKSRIDEDELITSECDVNSQQCNSSNLTESVFYSSIEKKNILPNLQKQQQQQQQHQNNSCSIYGGEHELPQIKFDNLLMKDEDLACVQIIETMTNRISSFHEKGEKMPSKHPSRSTSSNNGSTWQSDSQQTKNLISFKSNGNNNNSSSCSKESSESSGLGALKQDLSSQTITDKDIKSNCIQNNQVTSSSPNYIRERYYQILREQVFPFLQRPSQASASQYNQSAREIQNYSNDVLY